MPRPIVPSPHRYRIQQRGLYGLMDGAGRVVVPPTYTFLGDFCEGRAAAVVDGQVGYVDAEGLLVIPAAYDEARPFSEGRAAVRIGERWGYIDRTGEFVIVPQFT